ncbi:MAG: GIY-YIG nuclease family protein [Bacteroidia bacterium]|nr:GIY-YIG nuclease family protein [Bacteroidia bacterium]
MYFVYVLYSSDYDKIYIGYSANPEARLKAHNDNRNKGWTAKYKPWIIKYSETLYTKREALLREKQLKSFRGREFIRSLLA